MTPDKPHITVRIAGRALYPLLRPFAVGYFLAVCAVDLVYSQASILVRYDAKDIADITEWLLVVGLAMMTATALVSACMPPVACLWGRSSSTISTFAGLTALPPSCRWG
jgi:uncharacterized membrane protein